MEPRKARICHQLHAAPGSRRGTAVNITKHIEEHAERVADAVVHLMQAARDNPNEPLDNARSEIADQARKAMRPLLDQEAALEAAMDGAADAVLEVAAGMLSQFATLTGTEAARMVRELKKGVGVDAPKQST
jgi:hypothetical protein